MKPFNSHTAQLIKRSCKRFTAAVLVLLLSVIFIPSDYEGKLFGSVLDVAANVYIAQAAVVADMAVGEEYYDITSIVLTYHNPNSTIVQTQAQYHGAY